jgi:hypothetical protein
VIILCAIISSIQFIINLFNRVLQILIKFILFFSLYIKFSVFISF